MNNLINDVKFFQGGNAIFTVKNDKDKHYTYRIRQPKGNNKPFFISLLTGSDNTESYTYLGIYNPLSNNVILTQKSKYTNESTPVKVIRWAIKKINEKSSIPNGYSIQHEGKCCRCGRTLTTPNSINNGIGPECIKYF